MLECSHFKELKTASEWSIKWPCLGISYLLSDNDNGATEQSITNDSAPMARPL